MDITLNSIKFSAIDSQETHCFVAIVYIDGKRMFTVGNNGMGGSNYYEPNYYESSSDNVSQHQIYEQVKKINDVLGQDQIVITEELTVSNNLDIVIGNIMNDWLIDNDIKRH